MFATPTIHVNRGSVARSITTSLGASKELDSLAAGLLQPGEYMPSDEGQYWQFRRYMHDILCAALIDNGTFRMQTFNLDKVGIVTNDPRMVKQKPDLYTVNDTGVHLGEVSVTYNVDLESKRKNERYRGMCDLITKHGMTCRLDIILLDLTDPEWRDKFSAISELFLNMLEDFIQCLQIIHSDKRFSAVRAQELGSYNVSRLQYVLEDETIVDQIYKATGVVVDPKHALKLIDNPGLDEMTDSEYISRLATSIINTKPQKRPTPEPRGVQPQTMLNEFKPMFESKPTTHKLPRILQLGAPQHFDEAPRTFDQTIESLRTTSKSGGYLDHLKNSLSKEVPDSHTRIVRLSMSTEQIEKEQQQGPGRKAYMKRNGLSSPREEPRHIGLKPEHETSLLEMIENITSDMKVLNLEEPPEPSVAYCGISMATELDDIQTRLDRSSTTGLLRFYQSISNEIVINSMRRRKQGEYVLGYSGFVDVFFIVAPGPQLRTESNIEFVKIISLRPGFMNGFSAPWHLSGDHWESDWLSVDVDRLKHWQRAFDRVSVSLLANVERLVRPGYTMRQCLKEEMAAGNYTFLALTYLEDKQLTSVTNQTLRYLWMKSLGDKQFEGLASKFPQRVNSIIQSTMLQRAIKSCVEICRTPLTELVKVNKLHRDDETGMYDETTTGITNLLPRLFTFGQRVPVSYNLNEIYWCMAYNKDRQNAAQDALRILEKIVKEEHKYDLEIGCREGVEKVHYFLGCTSIKQDINHAHSLAPEGHFYSSRAVQIGVRLQDKHPENVGDNGSWMTSEKLEKILSKPLSDYATFKASVKQIAEYVNPNDLAELKKIGVRTKAIELVAEIVEKEELMTASEIVMQYSGMGNRAFEILIQIFKKGQIGGVREIIILFIKARVMMNVVEEVARLLCKSDKREILTKGRDKRLMMRGDYEEVTSSFPDGTPVQVVKESYDMTTWCQKFIPFIFTHIHRHHFKDHPGMSSLATHIFLAHSNKKIEFPRKLVEQWCLHKEEKHSDKAMQKIKEKYLRDGKPYLVNHSNMCQGIPHYNSSVLGLSCISLRDALFKECLEQLSQTQCIQWKTRLGSDDKGTIIALDMSNPNAKAQCILFGQCERVSERLHSMELSIKSASGHVMYELNSAYMANLETLSPTIKFSLASTDTIETTSCTTFVNESYSRIRQMRENGASSLLCFYAHLRNSRHFDKIFGTSMGDVNDVSAVFKQPKSTIPYDFGIYPLYDADLQDVIGPEFYNYRILKTKNHKNLALKLLYTPLSKREQDEMFQREEDDLMKKDHFGIQQGIVKQLANMRERTNSRPEEIEAFFEENPFLIVRGPQTVRETLMVIRSKLFTKGAAQALRRTSPAIYIGRLSAYRSAKAWIASTQRQVGVDLETGDSIFLAERSKVTYLEYLQMGLAKAESNTDFDPSSLRELLFPNHRSLDVIEQLVGKFGALQSTDRKFSQAIRTWTINNFNYEYTSGLRSILQTSFGEIQDSSKEDVEEFRKMVGMRMESLDNFVEECKQRSIRPLDMFFYLTKLHKASRSSRIQSFAFGPTSQSLHMTAMSLKKYNHMPGMVSMMGGEMKEDHLKWANTMASKLDTIKLLHNMIVMEQTGRLTSEDRFGVDAVNPSYNSGSLIDESRTIIRGLRSISGLDYTSQKSVKLVAAHILDDSEFRSKLVEWKDLNFTYVRRQKKVIAPSGKVSWQGDLEVLVSSGEECFTMSEVRGRRFVTAKQVTDLSQLFRSLVAMCKNLDMELHSFFRRRPMNLGDIYLSDSSRSLHRSEVVAAQGNVLNLRINKGFRYKRIVDLVAFKTVRTFDEARCVLSVHFEDKEGRTATVCHSLGNYYPVSIPDDLQFSEGLWYQGVRFNSLIRNRDWFFNRRLPTMSENEVCNFLRRDVDFRVVLQNDSSDLSRITDYLEVREEVNEESFPQFNMANIQAETSEDDTFDAENMYEIFEKAVSQQVASGEMSALAGSVEDWADLVEEELERVLTLDSGEHEGNVLVARSFGYKKPKQRKAAYTINNLQQGVEIKARVLDSFFRMGSVKSEAVKSLPSYIAWTLQVKRENQEFSDLAEALVQHMIKSLSESTGVKQTKLRNAIEMAPGRLMLTPLRPLFSLINGEGETMTQDDIMADIYRLSEDFQEEISDNEDY
ncbi:MAG: RNA-dependent RNA polymerase [Coniothyrium diplodiella negative-stranded RNA virus 1]|uniref:RNA-dependent RNA polymerase n=1 Tax=Coniothyrium diplodiella negative-stranded RNA virus 1 TaxID=2587545 RepID=UPI0024843821|nr:MAG: RNA-dependent RNA polymerase [Coniothyrium diplodiella negative-stranded RNA virus 1]QDB75015.1 MAG: RNA-dependent RNA polymerase [Coniothyrium diplodiella negative-stranded RNA virus 1]